MGAISVLRRKLVAQDAGDAGDAEDAEDAEMSGEAWGCWWRPESQTRWCSTCQAAQFISLELTKSKKKGFADSAPPSSAMHFVT
jgi:hypothetical protein